MQPGASRDMLFPGLVVICAAGWNYGPRSIPALPVLLWGPRADAEVLRRLPGSLPFEKCLGKGRNKTEAEREGGRQRCVCLYVRNYRSDLEMWNDTHAHLHTHGHTCTHTHICTHAHMHTRTFDTQKSWVQIEGMLEFAVREGPDFGTSGQESLNLAREWVESGYGLWGGMGRPQVLREIMKKDTVSLRTPGQGVTSHRQAS